MPYLKLVKYKDGEEVESYYKATRIGTLTSIIVDAEVGDYPMRAYVIQLKPFDGVDDSRYMRFL